MARKAFWTDAASIDINTGTVWVNVSAENEPGYARFSNGWPNLEAAEREAERLNASRGLTRDEAREILMSSHRASNAEADRQEMLDLTPDVNGLILFARKILREADSDSLDAEVARKILSECGMDE